MSVASPRGRRSCRHGRKRCRCNPTRVFPRPRCGCTWERRPHKCALRASHTPPTRMAGQLRGALEIHGRQRVIGRFRLPKDRDDPPSRPIVHQLNTVDAPDDGAVSFPTPFIRAEDMGNMAELDGPPSELLFVEAAPFEQRTGRCDVVVDFENSDSYSTAGARSSWEHSPTRYEQRPHTSPVPRPPGGPRDDVIHRIHDRVDGCHVCRGGGRDGGDDGMRGWGYGLSHTGRRAVQGSSDQRGIRQDLIPGLYRRHRRGGVGV